MKDFRVWEILLNPPLVAALSAMASSQLFKALKPLAKGRMPDLRKIADYGGWPSSHTAFIVACTVSVGIVEGFRSSLFALALAHMAPKLTYALGKVASAVPIVCHISGGVGAGWGLESRCNTSWLRRFGWRAQACSAATSR